MADGHKTVLKKMAEAAIAPPRLVGSLGDKTRRSCTQLHFQNEYYKDYTRSQQTGI